MAWCRIHLGTEAAHVCTRCGQPYCDACLADILGGFYCAACKEAAVADLQRVLRRSPEAIASLILGICTAVMCYMAAPLISGVGLVMGLRALNEARRDPERPRADLEWAGVLLNGAAVILWLVGLLLGALVWFRS
jgi:hypothetical protein